MIHCFTSSCGSCLRTLACLATLLVAASAAAAECGVKPVLHHSIDGVESVERSVEVDSTLSKVWAAIASTDGLQAWFGAEAKVEPTIGGAYEIYFWPKNPIGQRGIEGTTILSLVPENILSFQGSAPPDFPKIRQKNVAWTTYSLRELPAGGVEITQFGSWPTFGELWEEDFRAWVDEALRIGLGRLANYLDPDSSCETVASSASPGGWAESLLEDPSRQLPGSGLSRQTTYDLTLTRQQLVGQVLSARVDLFQGLQDARRVDGGGARLGGGVDEAIGQGV